MWHWLVSSLSILLPSYDIEWQMPGITFFRDPNLMALSSGHDYRQFVRSRATRHWKYKRCAIYVPWLIKCIYLNVKSGKKTWYSIRGRVLIRVIALGSVKQWWKHIERPDNYGDTGQKKLLNIKGNTKVRRRKQMLKLTYFRIFEYFIQIPPDSFNAQHVAKGQHSVCY